MNRVRIISRHIGDDGKTYVTVRNAHGRTYGLREIGDRKAWHRFTLKNGQKFRFAKDAAAHLDGEQLTRDLAAMRARKAAEEARLATIRAIESRREADRERMLARLGARWGARVVDASGRDVCARAVAASA